MTLWWLTIPVIIYSVLIFVLWLLLRSQRTAKALPQSGSIFISVVVACRNEEDNIVSLLQTLAAQNYPKERYEVIVVNDNSSDGTAASLATFIKSGRDNGMRLITAVNPFNGKKSAVRHGIGLAEGEVILTTDADCIVGPDWIGSYASYFEKNNPDMVLAPVNMKAGKGFFSLFAASEFSALQGLTAAAVAAGEPVMCNGANMGYRKDIYDRHSGDLHDEIASGDDIFLLHALKRAKGRICYLGSEATAVQTAVAVGVAALLSQRARWASKAFYYRDRATIILAATTAACNAAVTAAALISCFSFRFLALTGLLYAIRMVPDYLMITCRMKKRKEHLPLLLFLPMELIYPFYLVIVSFLSLLPPMQRFRHS